MKAAILRDVKDLKLEQVPDPKPSDDQVLIQIKSCGVCATDVNMWRGTNTEGKFPFILGHEWVGHIVEAGRHVTGFSVGERVVGEVTVACKRCRNCNEGMPPEACLDSKLYGFGPDTPGGMAEYHVTDPGRLHRIPDDVTDEEATLVEPISVGYHGVWGSGGGVQTHDRVVVFGAGPIGLLTMLTCKAASATVVVVEPNARRRQMAMQFGADDTIDPTQGDLDEQVMALTDGRGASLVVECSGNDTARAAAVDVVANRGRIVLIGISAHRKVPLDVDKLIFRCATVVGSDGSAFYFAKPIELLSRRLVNYAQVITHRFPLDKVGQAIELGAGQGESCKILVVP